MQKHHGGDLKRASTIGGASFAAVRLYKAIVEVVQACDCFAIWVTKSGKISATKNQLLVHDREMNAEILRIMRQVADEKFRIRLEKATEKQRGIIRKEMWNRFFPILCEARDADCNNPASPRKYALLNGQPGFMRLASSFTLNRKNLKYLFLVTDGMLPWCLKTEDIVPAAKKLVTIYKNGGLFRVVQEVEKMEKEKVATNYVNFAEKTAIAIEL